MMTGWSPFTKLTLLGGVLLVPYLLWSSPESVPGVTVPAAARERLAAAEADAITGLQPAPRLEALPPLQSFAAVVERPLFVPSRRLVRAVEAPPPPELPPEPEPTAGPEPATEAATPETEPPSLRLFGTIRQGGATAALVTVEGESGVKKLSLGEDVGGWRVIEVTRNELKIEHEGRAQTFTIFGPREGAPAGADDGEAGDGTDGEQDADSDESGDPEPDAGGAEGEAGDGEN